MIGIDKNRKIVFNPKRISKVFPALTRYTADTEDGVINLTDILRFLHYLQNEEKLCPHSWKLFLDSSPTYGECRYCGKRRIEEAGK